MKHIFFQRSILCSVLFLFALFFIPLFTLAQPGCCVANDGTCSEQTDISSCAQGAGLTGPYPDVLTCNVVSACDVGCCCAGVSAPNRGINNDENALGKTRASCQLQGQAYIFREGQAGSSCVQICNGVSDDTTGSTTRHNIHGHVREQDGTAVVGATVNIPYLSSTFSATTNGEGEFVISNIPPLQGTAIVTKPGCTPVSNPINIGLDTDGYQGTYTMFCGQLNSCTPATLPQVTASAVFGTPNAQLTLSADRSLCGTPGYYRITRTDEEGRSISFIQTHTASATQTYVDTNLEAETTYTYAIDAFYSSLGFYPSLDSRQETTFTTGVQECMQGTAQGTIFCENTENFQGDITSKKVRCKNDNTVERVDSCAQGNICVPATSGNPTCTSVVACDLCNGPFGMFGTQNDPIFSAIFQGYGEQCSISTLRGMCYQDNFGATTDAYSSCFATSRCEQYASQNACQNNPCVVSDTCRWEEVFPELGKGTCQSTTQQAACSSCESVYGFCNEQVCTELGGETNTIPNCYFDGESNTLAEQLPSQCIHKDDMACAYYDTQQECTGGTPASVDVVYDAQGNRIGGTNTITPSNDLYAIGTCKWSSTAGRCYSDANGYEESSPRDDCAESGAVDEYGSDCYADTEPPVTSLLAPQGNLPLHQLANIGYVVTDNFYPAHDIHTRFCAYSAIQTNMLSTTPCYPNKTLSSLHTTLVNLTVGQQIPVQVRFYSWDRSGNLETIQSQEIVIVDQGVPILQSATAQ